MGSSRKISSPPNLSIALACIRSVLDCLMLHLHQSVRLVSWAAWKAEDAGRMQKIRCTRAGAGPHGGAQWGLRRAGFAKCRAFIGLFHSFENPSAGADAGFFGFDSIHLENTLGIVIAVFIAQPI